MKPTSPAALSLFLGALCLCKHGGVPVEARHARSLRSARGLGNDGTAAGRNLQTAEPDPHEHWVGASPHVPPKELEEILYNAGYTEGAGAQIFGAVMVTSGSRFALSKLLSRFLKGLHTSLDGDLTHHVIVAGLGASAGNICTGLKARYNHHCLTNAAWPGPDEEYEEGDHWFATAQLFRLELVLNVITYGYSVVYLDPDALVFRNPLPALLELDADVAVPEERCAATRDATPLPAQAHFAAYTGILWAEATPRAVRFVYDWLRLHRKHMSRHPNNKSDDAAIFNGVLARWFLAFDGKKHFVRVHHLSQERFPSWCSGPCGCQGATAVPPEAFTKEEDDELGVVSGVLECPAPAVATWLAFHYACTKGVEEKAALMDIGLALMEDVRPIDVSYRHFRHLAIHSWPPNGTAAAAS